MGTVHAQISDHAVLRYLERAYHLDVAAVAAEGTRPKDRGQENRAVNALMKIEAENPPLALDIPKGQSFEEWVQLGRQLSASSQVINWYIGDWWAAGQHRYGARAQVAAEGIFGKEFGTLANAASVCRAFETSRRRESLTYTHHVEVAALPPDEADKLLERAEAEHLTTRELRKAVMKHRLGQGHFPTRNEDDPEYAELMAIARAWNRARPDVRQQFLDLAHEAGTAVIEP